MTLEIPLNKCPHCQTFDLVYKPLFFDGKPAPSVRLFFGAEEVDVRQEDANFFCSRCFRAFMGSALIEADKSPGLGLDFKGTVAFRDVGVLVDVDLTHGFEKMTYRLVRKSVNFGKR